MTGALTVTEACARWGWSRRTFARYIAGGLKARAVRATDGAKLYEVQDIERFIRRLDPRGRKPRRKTPIPAAVPPADADKARPRTDAPDPAVTTVDPSELSERALAKASPDELIDMQKRIAAAERACYGKWARAMQDFQAGKADWTPAELALLHRSWRESQEMVRRLAMVLPEILYRKNRFVDAVVVGAILGRAAAIVASELDGLGISIAEKCHDAPNARVVRDIIDDAVSRARLALVTEMERMIPPQETTR